MIPATTAARSRVRGGVRDRAVRRTAVQPRAGLPAVGRLRRRGLMYRRFLDTSPRDDLKALVNEHLESSRPARTWASARTSTFPTCTRSRRCLRSRRARPWSRAAGPTDVDMSRARSERHAGTYLMIGRRCRPRGRRRVRGRRAPRRERGRRCVQGRRPQRGRPLARRPRSPRRCDHGDRRCLRWRCADHRRGVVRPRRSQRTRAASLRSRRIATAPRSASHGSSEAARARVRVRRGVLRPGCARLHARVYRGLGLCVRPGVHERSSVCARPASRAAPPTG